MLNYKKSGGIMVTSCNTNLSRYPNHSITAYAIGRVLGEMRSNEGEKDIIKRRIRTGLEFFKNAKSADEINKRSRWHEGHEFQACKRTFIRMNPDDRSNPFKELEDKVFELINENLIKLELIAQKMEEDKISEIPDEYFQTLCEFFAVTQSLENERFSVQTGCFG